MPKIAWDKPGERRYETGVDRGVFYLRNTTTGIYNDGYAWNGLTAVTESPTGAEASPMYADNIKYLNLIAVEEFAATIEAFTYPDAFGVADGTAQLGLGLEIGQQARESFGFSYRTRIGNDLLGDNAGYKIHLVYGCLAAPSEKARATVNDSPEAATFSWSLTTTAVDVGSYGGKLFRPTAHIAISTLAALPADITELETALYGTQGTGSPEVGGIKPRMPLPAELVTMFAA